MRARALQWDRLPTGDQDQALDAAVDAIARRARVLDGADPSVAHALRTLAVELEERFERPRHTMEALTG